VGQEVTWGSWDFNMSIWVAYANPGGGFPGKDW
jgi:hypothetical protein